MTSKPQSDLELIREIGQNACRASFAVLFARYHQPSYQLARHILRDADAAEEAVQEAMVRVWTCAGQYREGNARGWILKIVARECVASIRSGRRKSARHRQGAVWQEGDGDPGRRVEQSEMLEALRRHLERLGADERSLLISYYGDGLSQDCLARAFRLPQRTISYRLKKSLACLRASLAGAGFAA